MEINETKKGNKNHSYLYKTLPLSKLWGHLCEIIRHPHHRPITSRQNQRFQQCAHQLSCFM
jgi:hypothetical protein